MAEYYEKNGNCLENINLINFEPNEDIAAESKTLDATSAESVENTSAILFQVLDFLSWRIQESM